MYKRQGDAYVENGLLYLEAVLNVDVTFSGASSVNMRLSKLRYSSKPFNEAYYSLSINRSETLTKIQQDPNQNSLKTITVPETMTLRLVLEILPQQSGKLSDRFSLEARTL